MSLVLGRLGARLGDLDETMRLLDAMDNPVDKVKYFICKTTNDNWILSLVMWCSDEAGFCRVKDIWIGIGMDVVRGVPNLTPYGAGLNPDYMECKVLPNYFGPMHFRDKSYVVERKSTPRGERLSPPVEIVTGLSHDSMICMSARDPSHAPFLQFAANNELMALLLKLSQYDNEFVMCPRKYFELDLFDGRYDVVVSQWTAANLQELLVCAPQFGITRLPDIGELCAWCSAPAANNRCANCKVAYYCNKTCQRRHWRNGHKITCP